MLLRFMMVFGFAMAGLPKAAAQETYQIETAEQFSAFLELVVVAMRPQARSYKCKGEFEDDKLILLNQLVGLAASSETQEKSLTDRALAHVSREPIDCADVQSFVNDSIAALHAFRRMEEFTKTGRIK